jgi:hypothetical protein
MPINQFNQINLVRNNDAGKGRDKLFITGNFQQEMLN